MAFFTPEEEAMMSAEFGAELYEEFKKRILDHWPNLVPGLLERERKLKQAFTDELERVFGYGIEISHL